MPYKVLEGTFGKCPGCKEPTFVCLASLLAEPPRKEWEVPEDILRAIYEGASRSYRVPKTDGALKRGMTCTRKKCRKRTPKHYWAEVVAGGLVGPFCKACLLEDLSERAADARGWRSEVPIYITPCNAKTLVEIRAALACAPPKPDTALRDEDITLF